MATKIEHYGRRAQILGVGLHVLWMSPNPISSWHGNDTGRRIMKNSVEWDGAGAISGDGKHNLQ